MKRIHTHRHDFHAVGRRSNSDLQKHPLIRILLEQMLYKQRNIQRMPHTLHSRKGLRMASNTETVGVTVSKVNLKFQNTPMQDIVSFTGKTTMPGVGPQTANQLLECNIKTPSALLGQYLVRVWNHAVAAAWCVCVVFMKDCAAGTGSRQGSDEYVAESGHHHASTGGHRDHRSARSKMRQDPRCVNRAKRSQQSTE